MILLDTDHLNILQIGKGPQYETLAARIRSFMRRVNSATSEIIFPVLSTAK